jgi:hypothetical protein
VTVLFKGIPSIESLAVDSEPAIGFAEHRYFLRMLNVVLVKIKLLNPQVVRYAAVVRLLRNK